MIDFITFQKYFKRWALENGHRDVVIKHDLMEAFRRMYGLQKVQTYRFQLIYPVKNGYTCLMMPSFFKYLNTLKDGKYLKESIKAFEEFIDERQLRKRFMEEVEGDYKSIEDLLRERLDMPYTDFVSLNTNIKRNNIWYTVHHQWIATLREKYGFNYVPKQ